MIAIMFGQVFRKLASGHTRNISLDAGDVLFRHNEQIVHVYLVEQGLIALRRVQKNGNETILMRYGSDDLVAEASVYSAQYHCEAVAIEDTKLLQLPRSYMARWLKSDPAFAHEWAVHLARELQRARQRNDILACNQVSDKIDSWQAWHGALPKKGTWKHFAAELGVSPEALYRELKKRKT